jgi:hypothetical protein
MTSLVNRIAMLAAGAMVLGTMAYGQTEMKAQIPFAFQTATSSYPAGQYTIGRANMTSGYAITTLQKQATMHKEFVSGGLKDTWTVGSPALLFRCSDGSGCVLTSVRTPDGSISYSPSSKKARYKDEAALIVIPLRAVNAD